MTDGAHGEVSSSTSSTSSSSSASSASEPAPANDLSESGSERDLRWPRRAAAATCGRFCRSRGESPMPFTELDSGGGVFAPENRTRFDNGPSIDSSDLSRRAQPGNAGRAKSVAGDAGRAKSVAPADRTRRRNGGDAANSSPSTGLLPARMFLAPTPGPDCEGSSGLSGGVWVWIGTPALPRITRTDCIGLQLAPFTFPSLKKLPPQDHTRLPGLPQNVYEPKFESCDQAAYASVRGPGSWSGGRCTVARLTCRQRRVSTATSLLHSYKYLQNPSPRVPAARFSPEYAPPSPPRCCDLMLRSFGTTALCRARQLVATSGANLRYGRAEGRREVIRGLQAGGSCGGRGATPSSPTTAQLQPLLGLGCLLMTTQVKQQKRAHPKK